MLRPKGALTRLTALDTKTRICVTAKIGIDARDGHLNTTTSTCAKAKRGLDAPDRPQRYNQCVSRPKKDLDAPEPTASNTKPIMYIRQGQKRR